MSLVYQFSEFADTLLLLLGGLTLTRCSRYSSKADVENVHDLCDLSYYERLVGQAVKLAQAEGRWEDE